MNTEPAATTPSSAAPNTGIPRGMLFASAAVLAFLVIVRLGTLASPAHAELPAAPDVVSRVGDFTMLTLGADNDDVLIVLDGRNESLAAYRVKNKNSLELIEARELKAIFSEARRIGSGK